MRFLVSSAGQVAGLRHVVLNRMSRFYTAVVVLMDVFTHEVDTVVSSVMMLIWSIWQKRNNWIWNQQSTTVHELCSSVQVKWIECPYQ
jgi:hypothetical protein